MYFLHSNASYEQKAGFLLTHSSTKNVSGIILSKPHEIQKFYFSKFIKSLLPSIEVNERETLKNTEK